MSDGVNRVFLLGNLGADPELRTTNGGDFVLNMRLATSKTYLDRNKVKQERTEWHSVNIWGARAEALAKFLRKGSRLHVEGELRYSSYEDKTGEKRYRTDIVASNVALCGGAPGSRGDDRQGADRKLENYDDADYGQGGDDIPF